ncbi:CidA/LrgA family protein [Phytohalomonas tamaricis]|uniref:CidA/LrgA family protein n=1 Tax=Phytohalomonas tamaricis TaxID=2081032 RepID=UPI000D0BA0F2|nr:CidA/LrgA family protein [Phytohalomonas tamaricis]
MPLLVGMCVLLTCQLIGELIARGASLPIPGPVIGMMVLLVGLMLHGRTPDGVRLTSEGLLRYLALLFVPAGVGVMTHFELIRANLWTLIITLIVSTVVTQALTALLLRRLNRHRLEDHEAESQP